MSMTSAVISFSTTTTYNDNNKNNNCTGKFPLVSKNICHPLMFTVDTVEHRGTLIDQKISCSLKGNTILGKNMHFWALSQTLYKGTLLNGYIQLYKHLLLFKQKSVHGIIWYCGTDINRVSALPVGLQSITIPGPPLVSDHSLNRTSLYHWDTSTCKQRTCRP